MADADDDARTIGRRVRQVRRARGKSLRVVAELAGLIREVHSSIAAGRDVAALPELAVMLHTLGKATPTGWGLSLRASRGENRAINDKPR